MSHGYDVIRFRKDSCATDQAGDVGFETKKKKMLLDDFDSFLNVAE